MSVANGTCHFCGQDPTDCGRNKHYVGTLMQDVHMNGVLYKANGGTVWFPRKSDAIRYLNKLTIPAGET